jgi:hypothetical protein
MYVTALAQFPRRQDFALQAPIGHPSSGGRGTSKAKIVRCSVFAGSSLCRKRYRNPVSPRFPLSLMKLGCVTTTCGIAASTFEKSLFLLNNRMAVFVSRHER